MSCICGLPNICGLSLCDEALLNCEAHNVSFPPAPILKGHLRNHLTLNCLRKAIEDD